MHNGRHTRDVTHTLGTSTDTQCTLPADSPWCSGPSWSTGGINTLVAVFSLVSFPDSGSDPRNDLRDHLQARSATDDEPQTRYLAGELTACSYCNKPSCRCLQELHRACNSQAIQYCFILLNTVLRPPVCGHYLQCLWQEINQSAQLWSTGVCHCIVL
jgi:hypothetical protein